MNIKTKISKVFMAVMLFTVLLAGQVFAAATDDFEIGTQNLNNTVENSAKVGDQLLKPEKGWKRYDDSNSRILYSGIWDATTTHRSYYKGTIKYTLTPEPKTIKFQFYGSKLRVIGLMYNSYGDNIKISIDGKNDFFSEQIAGVLNVALVFEKENLSFGLHTVEINSGGQSINFDAIDIDESGELKPYAPIEESIKASSLELNKSTLDMNVGGTDTLTATVAPENTTNKKIKWTTSDERIATVDENGKVTAIKSGTAIITATTLDGSNLSKSCEVTVTEQAGNENKLATSLTLNKTSLTIDVDKTALIGAVVKPDDTTNKAVKWVSSDPSIAIVYSNGKVKGVKPGKVTITATTQDGSNLSATCEVTVREPQGGEVEATEATLGITMVSGAVHQYDLSMTEVNKFIAWIDGRSNGQGSPYYVFEKKTDTGSTIKQYLMYDNIESFTVNPIK